MRVDCVSEDQIPESANIAAPLPSGPAGFADASPFPVVTTDSRGIVTFWNSAAEIMFDRARAEIIGCTLETIMPERFRAQHASGMRRMTDTGKSRLAGKSVEVVGLSGNGKEFPIELTITSWEGPNGREYGAFIQDITKRREREVRLEHLALNDPVTGLLNRQGFERVICSLGEETCRGALVRLEVRGLAALDDALEHDTFDMLLQTVALRLRAVVASDDILARVADDGFALFTPEGGIDAAITFADRLIATFKEPIIAGCLSFVLPVAAGIAVAPTDAMTPEALLTYADLAMFQTRCEVGGACRTFEPWMAYEAAAKREFRGDIFRATTERQWEVWYQPQVDLSDGAITSAEALLRWRHPMRGLLAPASFLSTLETHAVAYEVGLWVLDEACRQLVAWRSVGHKIRRVAVNLFTVQLQSTSLVDDVTRALDRHGLGPGDLELEIPETVAFSTDEDAINRLRRLRDIGIAVALDDFGTGFAALYTLKQLPVTRLKIDKSFVQDVQQNRTSRAIVGAILLIGRELGIDVIAEGIETAEHSRALSGLGCEAAQGYFYGRPAPAEAMFPTAQR